MIVRKEYSNPGPSMTMRAKLICCFILFAFFFIVVQSGQIYAQDLPEYDEISVFLEIPRVGGGDINAVIKGQELFLPVTDLFDFLKIRNVPSPEFGINFRFFY